MLTNYHTHSTFCDGHDEAEVTVRAAIDLGFSAIGFSGHGNTPYDLSYCMTDVEGYRNRIRRLQTLYADRIEILLGIEEDIFALTDRSKYDYIIGSCHYICKDGAYYSVDSGTAYRDRCLQLFGGDPAAYAENYYQTFCSYICTRKPDIIGHFDLITKYEESAPCGLLEDARCRELAKKYIALAAQSGCVFEVNTGAMARGLRTSPYPSEELLHVLKQQDASLVLSSDCHSAKALTFGFAEVKHLLRQIGFRFVSVLRNGEFVKESI